ncbi:MAG: relaxase MobL [Pyrinomonadaceae bacterium]
MQSKRGSSRGLVHYIARSKIESLKEPKSGRELFNEFSNDLSVESSNNSLKIGLSKQRVSNDSLHHLVISFREADYRKLGGGEEKRKAALRDITRTAMAELKTHLNAEKIFWVGAVHLNTANPHVHIAMRKEFFSQSLDKQHLTKMPREMLPHYEIVNNERSLVPGHFVRASEQKMESIIAQEHATDRSLRQPRIPGDEHSFSDTEHGREKEEMTSQNLRERTVLGKSIIGENSLRQIDSRINQLVEDGDKMRFLVTDSVSGVKKRLSLRDLDQYVKNDRLPSTMSGSQNLPGRPPAPVEGSVGTENDGSERRTIKTILLKMLAKQESQKAKVEQEFGSSIQEASTIRAHYRKEGQKLPIPTLSKSDIDKLQEQCLETSDLRQFAYLERVRSELEKSGEIDGRSEKDFRRIFAQKTLTDLRSENAKRTLIEFDARRFYQFVDLDGQSISLARLDKNLAMKQGSGSKILEKVRGVIRRITRTEDPVTDIERTKLRESIEHKLEEAKLAFKTEQNIEAKQSVLLEKVLKSQEPIQIAKGMYFPQELEEIEKLSLLLNLREVYEQNWSDKRALIESAGADCPAARRLSKNGRESEFDNHKLETIGGRANAGEIVAKIHLEKAEEELEAFKKTKRFHKFSVINGRDQRVEYLSLKDVDLPSKHSLLDQAVDLIVEGTEHRRTRKIVLEMVKEKEQKLKSDYRDAKEIHAAASAAASEFKKPTFLSLRSEPVFAPIFTPSEISLIEFRIDHTQNSKEAAGLKSLLSSTDPKTVRSTTKLLRDFDEARSMGAEAKEHGLHELEKSDGQITKANPSRPRLPVEQVKLPSEINERPLPEISHGIRR